MAFTVAFCPDWAFVVDAIATPVTGVAAAAGPSASGEAITADTDPITTAAAAQLLAGRLCQLFINFPLRLC